MAESDRTGEELIEQLDQSETKRRRQTWIVVAVVFISAVVISIIAVVFVVNGRSGVVGAEKRPVLELSVLIRERASPSTLTAFEDCTSPQRLAYDWIPARRQTLCLWNSMTTTVDELNDLLWRRFIIPQMEQPVGRSIVRNRLGWGGMLIAR
mmetsp:Transcript_3502/g.4805  ORF Transcript_3502/g.4805 Transcript_3502/m.4805 type:complete len:152 (+) Transcript_3502:1629-2084(+)